MRISLAAFTRSVLGIELEAWQLDLLSSLNQECDMRPDPRSYDPRFNQFASASKIADPPSSTTSEPDRGDSTDLITVRRDAYAAGLMACGCPRLSDAYEAARRKYPRTVTRPRIITQPRRLVRDRFSEPATEWKLEHGAVWMRVVGSSVWRRHSSEQHARERHQRFADLLANPTVTETV